MALTNYTDYTTNSSNPFYLHPNENPSMILVTPLLDNKNYHTWARLMMIALISKNKDKFIDGTLPKPASTDPMFSPWMRCNTMVISWIQSSTSESIAQSVLSVSTAADVWKDLRNHFSQGDIFRISDLQEDLYRFRQGNLDVSYYFTQLKVFWNELEDYRPIPYCKCSITCSCGGYPAMKLFREQDYVIRFLKGLNDRFSHTKSQIMAMDPLPGIDKAFSLVIQQERELVSHAAHETTDQSLALASNTPQNNYTGKGTSNNGHGNGPGVNFNTSHRGGRAGRGRGGFGRNQIGHSRVCTQCNRFNHTIDTCYLLHGFPPGYKSQGKGQANLATTDSLVHTSATPSSVHNFGFTQEQYEGLRALIQQSNVNSDPQPLIRETREMSCTLPV